MEFKSQQRSKARLFGQFERTTYIYSETVLTGLMIKNRIAFIYLMTSLHII